MNRMKGEEGMLPDEEMGERSILGTAVSLVLDDDDHDDFWVNTSHLNTSTGLEGLINATGMTPGGRGIVRHLPLQYEILITGCYVFGILGNLAALYIITNSETQRYRKQTLMLQCLAGNDLVALMGSCVQMYMHLYLPVADTRWFCAFRVLWRAFGLGSGCVALVMALERWLALTHPFTYQKHVTFALIRRSILGLWTFNLILVCAPFLGFGLWYDRSSHYGVTPCVRYRHGTTPGDRAYALLVFAFGILMCSVIVCCNLSVIRVLCRMRERLMPRRHSHASCRSTSSHGGDNSMNHATIEELSFAKLMAVISIFFVICWVPQLMTIIVAQLEGPIPSVGRRVYRIADIFIALNFTIDPYMYVLFRRQRRCGNRHFRKLTNFLCPKSLKDSPRKSLVNGSLRSSSNNTNGKESENGSGGKNTASTHYPSIDKEYIPLELLLSSTPADKIQSEVFRCSGSGNEAEVLPLPDVEYSPILEGEESLPAGPNRFRDSDEAV